MRILWFTNTPSLYKANEHIYNGGGWIESLELNLRQREDISLGISFFHSDSVFKDCKDSVTYYPISQNISWWKKQVYRFSALKKRKNEIKHFRKVVEDFNPDIIEVFGSELNFGFVSQIVSVPVLLHIQGVLSPYYNAWYPPGYSKSSMLLHLWRKPFKLIKFYLTQFDFYKNSLEERLIYAHIKYFAGRTDWDKKLSSLFSPSSKYYYCSEILRTEFYQSPKWNVHNRDSDFVLVTTISDPLYKGFDLVLKSAKILTDSSLSFEWRVFGNISPKLMESKTNIVAENVNVKLYGVATPKELVENLLDADIFIHPSYIDNSPNSLCEAQLLGLPVISTFVGGIPSLIEQNKTGVLVPANDPYFLANTTINILHDTEFMTLLGENARTMALHRHDPQEITSDLLSIYKNILEDQI